MFSLVASPRDEVNAANRHLRSPSVDRSISGDALELLRRWSRHSAAVVRNPSAQIALSASGTCGAGDPIVCGYLRKQRPMGESPSKYSGSPAGRGEPLEPLSRPLTFEHLPRLGNLTDLRLLEPRVPDASGEKVLEQPVLHPPGLLDDRLGRLDGLVHGGEDGGDLLLLRQRRELKCCIGRACQD